MVQQAVEMVRSAPALLGDSRLLCVDGPAGSGKTTLALRLVGSLKQHGLAPETLHMDNLYEGWTGLDNGLERRVLTQVLAPLSRGDAAKWQRYDWDTSRFDGWQALSPPAVLVLEGCGSGALAYASYRSLLVWVEASSELRLQRGVQRDGAAVLPHWLAWTQLEAAHFAANRTRRNADLVLVTG